VDVAKSDLAEVLAAAARTIDEQSSLPDTLETIARAAQLSIPDIDEVGISIVHRNGRIETRAATGQLVWDLDSLQYELGEGPCVSAMREFPVVMVDDLRHDQRWPRYVPRALAAGLHAQMAVRLYVEEETLGGLNMYSTQAWSINPDALHAAELFATHASVALGRARREEELHEALSTRQLIGQATGILMERYRIDDQRAFQYLVRVSSTTNTKLRLVAQRVVEETSEGGASAASLTSRGVSDNA
jgi:GAF domain-containing protein